MNKLTDDEMAKGIAALAGAVKMAADNLENRQGDSRRCSCNVDGMPGLCAYHAWAYSELAECAERLERVRSYLLKPRNER